jgi:hypothetical protein
MGLFKDDPPAPPDPRQTAAAQTGTNVSTAVANTFLNNMNQVTPEGSLSFNQTGEFTWRDPSTGHTYTIPRLTATQALSPQQETLRDYNITTAANLGNLAAGQSDLLRRHLSTLFQPGATAPAAADINLLTGMPTTQGTLGDVGQVPGTLANAGDITRTYGPADNFSADRARVEEALFQRMSPQLELDRQRLEQRLADQGIRYGDQAWQNAMNDFNRQLTDVRLGITAAGGAEQQRMMDMAAKEAGFQNAAQQQAYAQFLQTGQFGAQTQQQRFAQEQARINAYNNAIAQNLARNQSIFNAQNALRNQNIAEQYALRGQPINEITALLSGSQVQQPKFADTAQNQIATTDIAGLINQRFQQDLANTQLQNQNVNQLLGGILGAAGQIGKGFALSDRTMKEDIEKMGSVYAAGPHGEKPLPIYEYSYKQDPTSTRHVGPMAQDVEKIDRRAVRKIGGKKYIDKTKLGSILKVA